jgi:hypothetical protein
VTPSFSPPSSIAGFVESFVRIPISWATAATRRGFTFMPSSAKIELSEVAVADHSDAAPR